LIWAELLEVTSAAKDRGQAKCAHFQKCGGCHYQHILPEEQVRLKKDILRETVFAAGRDCVGRADPRALGGTLRIPKSRTVGGSQRDAAGDRIFPAGELGHIPIDECPVLSPRLTHAFLQLQRWRERERFRRGSRKLRRSRIQQMKGLR